MLATRPERVGGELFRVTRGGGTVAMGNYRFGGFLPRTVEMIQPYSPTSPLDLPSPFEWGEEAELRRRFDGLASTIEVQHRKLALAFDDIDDAANFCEPTDPPATPLHALLPSPPYNDLTP